MRHVAVVINTRLASTRCSRKIVRPFGDTTLLELALEKLSHINAAEKYLAAGDPEIIELYQPYSDRIHLLKREPDAIAAGEHPHKVSFRHYWLTSSRYILIMNPCLPFTRVQTYNRAISHFQKHSEIQTLTSVLPYQDIFFDENHKVITLPNVDHVSSVTAKTIYKMAHIFHIIDRSVFFASGRFWTYKSNDPAFLSVGRQECLDIDDEDDFEFCASIYKGMEDGFFMESNENKV